MLQTCPAHLSDVAAHISAQFTKQNSRQMSQFFSDRGPKLTLAAHHINVGQDMTYRQTPDRCFTVFHYEHGQPNDRLCKRSTYAGRLQYLTEHLTKNERVSFGRIFLENRKIVGDRCLHISLRYYTYIYIFYFSNPEHTHKISTCKNNKRTLLLWLNEGHNAS